MAFLNSFITQTITYATIYALTSLESRSPVGPAFLTSRGRGYAGLGIDRVCGGPFSGSWALGFVAGAFVGAAFGLLLLPP